VSWRWAIFMAALFGAAVGGWVEPWVPTVFSVGMVAGFLVGYVQARHDLLRDPDVPRGLKRHWWGPRDRADVTRFDGR
jgi:fructose-specific phosphotransferase system IIC component